jgi:hypothetical protein
MIVPPKGQICFHHIRKFVHEGNEIRYNTFKTNWKSCFLHNSCLHVSSISECFDSKRRDATLIESEDKTTRLEMPHLINLK